MERIAWPSHPESRASSGTEIIVLCDGTGKNGRVDKDPTNVYWLYHLLLANPYTGKPGKRRKRELLYIPGVGAESKGIPKYLALVFGKTIVEMVINAYMFIVKHYRPGDSVCLFGYSRGAFVARKVAGLLHRIGVVGNKEELLSHWQRREKPVPWDKVKDTKHSVPVRCLGVWDTVGAIYSSPECEEKDLLGIPDAELPPNVELALHILAYHENRKRFRVTLFEPNERSNLKQIWFPGAHSDVGGGGENGTKLPRVSLIWMLGELRGFIDIAENEQQSQQLSQQLNQRQKAQLDEHLEYPFLQDLEPSDAYNDSPAWKRAVDKFETRLDSKALQPTAKVHQTLRDIKQAAKESHSAHRQLNFGDLLSLKWNIRTGLVLCNTLEVLNQARSMNKGKWPGHPQSDRTRATSLPAFTRTSYYMSSKRSSLQVADVQTGQPIFEMYDLPVDRMGIRRVSNRGKSTASRAPVVRLLQETSHAVNGE